MISLMYQKDLCRQIAVGQLTITKWKMTPQSKMSERSDPSRSSVVNSIQRSVPATHMVSSWPGDRPQSISATKISTELKIRTVIMPLIYIQYQTAEKIREIKNKWLKKQSKINLIEFLERGLVSNVKVSLSSRTRPARFLSRQLLLQVPVQA